MYRPIEAGIVVRIQIDREGKHSLSDSVCVLSARTGKEINAKCVERFQDLLDTQRRKLRSFEATLKAMQKLKEELNL